MSTRTLRVSEPGKRLRIETLEDRLNLAASYSLACGGDVVASGSSVERTSQAINCFGLDVHELMAETSTGGNQLFSPASVAAALAMAHSGAAGDTAAEMARTLHFGSEPGIGESFRSFLDALAAQDVSMANAIWPREGLELRSSFVDGIDEHFRGTVQELDYTQPTKAANQINEWVEENTNRNIKNLIDDLDPQTKLVLTNAMYFKEAWKLQFNPKDTKPVAFELDDGREVTVPMMYLASEEFAYTVIGDYQVVELEFQGGDVSMVLMSLPKHRWTAEGAQLIPNTPPTASEVYQANAWASGNPPAYGAVLTMPRFSSTVSTDFIPILSSLGMNQALEDGADFSGFAEEATGWRIDGVGHKAMIEVNEAGAKLAAATHISYGACFAAGTPVLTAEGFRPIESLQIGDAVLARSEHNAEGNISSKRIEKTFQKESEIFMVRLADQTLKTTAEHPFFVKDQGWTAARELQTGDVLVCKVGETIVHETMATGKKEAVYNLTVADDRTYFVGNEDAAVWVHNLYNPAHVNLDQPFQYFVRDNATSTILFMGRMANPLETDSQAATKVLSAPQPRPGDANGDGAVDFADYLALIRNYGKEQDAVYADGDFNNDQVVNFADFIVLAHNLDAHA